MDRAKQKGTFDFSQNLIITPSGDFKQVSEGLKGLRGARDLVVFDDFCSVFSGFFSNFAKFTKHHRVTSTPKTLWKLA